MRIQQLELLRFWGSFEQEPSQSHAMRTAVVFKFFEQQEQQLLATKLAFLSFSYIQDCLRHPYMPKDIVAKRVLHVVGLPWRSAAHTGHQQATHKTLVIHAVRRSTIHSGDLHRTGDEAGPDAGTGAQPCWHRPPSCIMSVKAFGKTTSRKASMDALDVNGD